MKKSELRQIIREEIHNMTKPNLQVNEGFLDSFVKLLTGKKQKAAIKQISDDPDVKQGFVKARKSVDDYNSFKAEYEKKYGQKLPDLDFKY